MNASLGLGECKELEYFCWKDVADNLSFKAMDANGNCVGVFLCAVANAMECDSEIQSQQHKIDDEIYKKHKQFYKIIQLTGKLDRLMDLRGRHPQLREYAEAKVICVNRKYRGLGIAGQLVCRAFDEMRTRNLPLMTIQCSSHYSARTVQGLGFEAIASIPYCEFIIDGQQAISPAAPHSEITAFVKWIGDQQQPSSPNVSN